MIIGLLVLAFEIEVNNKECAGESVMFFWPENMLWVIGLAQEAFAKLDSIHDRSHFFGAEIDPFSRVRERVSHFTY